MTPEIGPGELGRVRRGRGCRRRSGRSRTDSLQQEGEEDAADLTAASDSRGEEPNVGGGLELVAEMVKLGEDEMVARSGITGEEWRGKREREQVGVFDVALDHQGGSGRAAWASPTRRHGASDDGHGGGERERKILRKAPDKF